MYNGKIDITTDTLMDLVLFEDIETANAKLAPLYLTAVAVEGKPGTVDIMTLFGGYVCTISPESKGKVAVDPQAVDEAGAILTSAQEDSDRETTVAIPTRPVFRRGAGPIKYKSDYRGAVKEHETDHNAMELEKSFRYMLSDPNSDLSRLLHFYARNLSPEYAPTASFIEGSGGGVDNLDNEPRVTKMTIHVADLGSGASTSAVRDFEEAAARSSVTSYSDRADYSQSWSATGGDIGKTVDSTSDERVANNTVRHAYRVLNDDEKAAMQNIKDLGLKLVKAVDALGKGREYSLAITKVEEAVMWAVKGLTK